MAMKHITIQRLRLENFKCHRLLELEFDGKSAALYGDNAAGKTSVYDGLCWLLFGKDGRGNGEKNIDIKPLLADGQVADHKAVTQAEAELSVDGTTVTLRRCLRERWTARRGSTQEVFDGNVSEYYIDGVPMQKNEYDRRVAALAGEEQWKLLTSVTLFAEGLDWKRRRAILFELGGTATEREIAESDARFAPLLQAAGTGTLDELKRKLAAQRKALTAAKSDLPARLSEIRTMLEGRAQLDFGRIRQELEAAEERLRGLRAQEEQNATAAKEECPI